MNADDDGCGDGLDAPPANPAEKSRRADATALDDVDDLDDGDGWAPLVEGQPPARAGIGSEDPKAKKRTLYSGPEEFMNQYLRFLVRRRLGGSHTWCSQWWAHPDAVLHITALWDTWEHYRREGDALSTSTWLLQRLGPHLTVLMSKDTGPFAACRPDRHCDIDPLPTSPAPPGTWAAAAFSDPDPD